MQRYIETAPMSDQEAPFAAESDAQHALALQKESEHMDELEGWDSVSAVEDPRDATETQDALQMSGGNVTFAEYMQSLKLPYHAESHQQQGKQALIQSAAGMQQPLSSLFDRAAGVGASSGTGVASTSGVSRSGSSRIEDPDAALQQLLSFTARRGLSRAGSDAGSSRRAGTMLIAVFTER